MFDNERAACPFCEAQFLKSVMEYHKHHCEFRDSPLPPLPKEGEKPAQTPDDPYPDLFVYDYGY